MHSQSNYISRYTANIVFDSSITGNIRPEPTGAIISKQETLSRVSPTCDRLAQLNHLLAQNRHWTVPITNAHMRRVRRVEDVCPVPALGLTTATLTDLLQHNIYVRSIAGHLSSTARTGNPACSYKRCSVSLALRCYDSKYQTISPAPTRTPRAGTIKNVQGRVDGALLDPSALTVDIIFLDIPGKGSGPRSFERF